jgi:hypothetical protein
MIRYPHRAAPQLAEGCSVGQNGDFILLEAAFVSERSFIRTAQEDAVQTTVTARTAFERRATLFAPQNVLFADWH